MVFVEPNHGSQLQQVTQGLSSHLVQFLSISGDETLTIFPGSGWVYRMLQRGLEHSGARSRFWGLF